MVVAGGKMLFLFDADSYDKFYHYIFMHYCRCEPPNYARKDHLVSLSVKSWNRSEM